MKNWLQISGHDDKIKGAILINDQVVIYDNLKHFRSLVEEEFKTSVSPYFDFLTRPLSTTNVFAFPDGFDHFSTREREDVEKAFNTYNGRCLLNGFSESKRMDVARIASNQYSSSRILCIVSPRKTAGWKSALGEKASVVSFEKLLRDKDQTTWGVVIVNDCEKLNGKKRAEIITPLLSKAKAVILLSEIGDYHLTNAYTLFSSIYPIVFNDKHTFTQRYSNGRVNKWDRWEEISIQFKSEYELLLSKLSPSSFSHQTNEAECDIVLIENTKDSLSLKECGLIKATHSEITKILKSYKRIVFVCKYLITIAALKQFINDNEMECTVHTGKSKPKVESDINIVTLDLFRSGVFIDTDICVMCEVDPCLTKMIRCERAFECKVLWIIIDECVDLFTFNKLSRKKKYYKNESDNITEKRQKTD